MKTLIYKKIRSLYECVDVIDGAGDVMRIVLGEPKNGKIRIGSRLYELTRGCAEISLDGIPDGEYTPTLITASRSDDMEAFILTDGKITRNFPSEQYIRTLGKICTSLEERIAELEEEISKIYKITDSTLTF